MSPVDYFTNLIADAQCWKTGAQISITNPGGIRAPLQVGDVNWGQLSSIQPFANELVTMDLSGSQLQSIFELQWSQQADGGERYRPLQVSGLRVVWDGSRPRGERIMALTFEEGTPLEPNATYRVTANRFIAGGGDGFWIFTDGSRVGFDTVDLTALAEYVEQLPQPFDARVEGRITRLD